MVGGPSADEWKECRATIGRFDSILADLRKYGFTIVALLLSANALITTANPVTERVAASSVIIALLVVLFLMDRYWWVMLLATTARAYELEKELSYKISLGLHDVAARSHNTLMASLAYVVFVLVASGVALVTVVPAGIGRGFWVMVGFTVLGVAVIAFFHVYYSRRFSQQTLSLALKELHPK
jgi:hypothetical protein